MSVPLPTSGSPPPAWGTLRADLCLLAQVRFTPTCVGNTSSRFIWSSFSTGSPPPAWGTLSHRSCHRCTRTVHPHLRGEHVVVSRYASEDARFTPTCVGNTGACLGSDTRPAVHPHLRGEHVLDVVRLRLGLGSPPPAWGTRSRLVQSLAYPRFTPTCVGNTLTCHDWNAWWPLVINGFQCRYPEQSAVEERLSPAPDPRSPPVASFGCRADDRRTPVDSCLTISAAPTRSPSLS